jgi:hypothetical protein
MQSKKMILPILVVLALGLAPSAFGQFAKTQSPFRPPQRELGYYDRATGAFTPLQPAAEDAEAAATTTNVTGEFVFNLTISLKSTLPKNAVIGCDAMVLVDDAITGLSYDEQGSAVATGSGSTWTCTIKIPYSWTLTTPTTADMVSMSYDASMVEGYQATATNGSATIVEGIPLRSSGHGLGSIKLPASGATTTETISVTL